MKYLFLDTNIWLHFRRVEDYSLGDLALGTELMVIVPEIILHELDNQKDAGKTARIKDAARHVSKCIKEVSQKEGMRESGYFKNKIGLGYFMEAPTPEFIHKLGLRAEKNDDVFLASIVLFRDLCKIAPEDIIVITNDTGMHIKAQNKLKMVVHELPDSYKLKEEDESQKKIRELERTVAQLSTKLPVLELMINGLSEEVCELVINMADFNPVNVRAELMKSQDMHAYMPCARELYQALSPISSLLAPSDEQIARYNRELGAYFVDFEKWLKQKWQIDWAKFIAKELIFSVSNSTFAATEAEVEIKFEAEVMLIRELPKVSSQPIPPKPPTSRMGTHDLTASLVLNDLHAINFNGIRSTSVDISSNGRELKGLLGNIKSTTAKSIDSVYIIPHKFDGHDMEVDFTFKITCMEAPAVTGKRTIRFKAR